MTIWPLIRNNAYAKFWRDNNVIFYIATDEIPGFFLLLKNHIFTMHSEHIIFIFHMSEYTV